MIRQITHWIKTSPFPGQVKTLETLFRLTEFHSKADSRPPEPKIKIFILMFKMTCFSKD